MTPLSTPEEKAEQAWERQYGGTQVWSGANDNPHKLRADVVPNFHYGYIAGYLAAAKEAEAREFALAKALANEQLAHDTTVRQAEAKLKEAALIIEAADEMAKAIQAGWIDGMLRAALPLSEG